jgi:hypothetical protein
MRFFRVFSKRVSVVLLWVSVNFLLLLAVIGFLMTRLGPRPAAKPPADQSAPVGSESPADQKNTGVGSHAK